MADPVAVLRGVLRCPRCGGRVIGYADVTIHPTILMDAAGRLSQGPIVDRMPSIKRSAKDTDVLGDEVYCEDTCGWSESGGVVAAWAATSRAKGDSA